MSMKSRVPVRRSQAAMLPIVRSVAAGDPITEVLRAVIDEANSVVGVISSCGQLVGTISERDILRCLPSAGTVGAAAQAYARFLQLRAADVMDDVDPVAEGDART
jgi:predicted transcriptional regulator